MKAQEKDLVSETIYNKENESKEAYRLQSTFKMLTGAILGFCFSQLDALGSISPFAYGFLGAVKFEYSLPVFIGSTLGCLIGFNLSLSLKRILCLFIICIFKLAYSKLFKASESSALSLASTAAGCLISFFANEITFMYFILSLAEAALALCSSYFFSRCFNTPVLQIGLSRLSASDKISLLFSLCSFTMCFSGIDIEGFSLARLCACFLICLSCICLKEYLPCLLSVCLGAALTIKPETRFLFPAFTLGGAIGCIFSKAGQIAVGISSCMSFLLCCILTGVGENMLFPAIEAILACGAFLLIPSDKIIKIRQAINKTYAEKDVNVNLQVCALLKKASENIYSFCDTVAGVSDRLDRIINPEANKLFFELQQKVCDGCGQKSACWRKDFDSTTDDVLVLLGVEKRKHQKLGLEKRCSRLHELKRQIIASRSEYSLNMIAKMKNREMRKLLTEQFCGIGDFLNELSLQFSKSRSLDNDKSAFLRGAVIEGGIYIDALNCYGTDESGLLIEAVSLDRAFETDYKKIKSLLEENTGKLFYSPNITQTEVGTLLSFEEKSERELIVGCAQRAYIRDNPCGDSVCLGCLYEGTHSVILSDGMGTGAGAALDSTMTVTLLEKLLSCGFSFDSAVKAVNSSLIMKSTDESMATVDGLCVNLFTGSAHFYKAGAALSLIRKGSEIIKIEESSLPLGILRGVSFAKVHTHLNTGDIVLLLSDGVTACASKWIEEELLSWSTGNMEDLARHIVELAYIKQGKQNGDDLTAVAVKIKEV